MPDASLKRLLVRLGLDGSEFHQQLQQIRGELQSVNEQAKRDAAALTEEARKHSLVTKGEIEDQRRMQAEARTLLEVDRAKAQWQKQQQAAIQTSITQRRLETEEVKKQSILQSAAAKVSQEQVRLEQMRLRLFEQQRMVNERALRQQTGGGPGGFGSLGKFASTLTGGGLMGSIVGGAFLGTGFERAMELGIEKVK